MSEDMDQEVSVPSVEKTGSQAVLLFSHFGSGDVLIKKRIRYVRDLCITTLGLDLLQIDGSYDKKAREELWALSGERSYPQLFIKALNDGKLTFFGTYDSVYALVETEKIGDADIARCIKRSETASRTPAASSASDVGARDTKRVAVLRTAVLKKDEATLLKAFVGPEADANFDALMRLVDAEAFKGMQLTKAVKGVVVGKNTDHLIELLEALVLPPGDGVKSPNYEIYKAHRPLLHLLVITLMKHDDDYDVMAYLRPIKPNLPPESVKMLSGELALRGLSEEAKFLAAPLDKEAPLQQS